MSPGAPPVREGLLYQRTKHRLDSLLTTRLGDLSSLKGIPRGAEQSPTGEVGRAERSTRGWTVWSPCRPPEMWWGKCGHQGMEIQPWLPAKGHHGVTMGGDCGSGKGACVGLGCFTSAEVVTKRAHFP